jgi:hypothetical protein
VRFVHPPTSYSGAAAVDHRLEDLLEIGGLGCRVLGLPDLPRHLAVERADQPDAVLLAQDRLHHVRRRGLSVRARDTDEFHLTRRVAMELTSDQREGETRVGDHDFRDTLGHRHVALEHHGSRPRLDRLVDELVAVGELDLVELGVDVDCDVEETPLHPQRIVDDSSDLQVRGPRDLFLGEGAQKVFEFHLLLSQGFV